jgi:hypothetical protein
MALTLRFNDNSVDAKKQKETKFFQAKLAEQKPNSLTNH